MAKKIRSAQSYISNFRIDPTPYKKSQADSIQWLAQEFATRNKDTSLASFEKLLGRVGALPPQIESRSHYLPDFAGDENIIFSPEKDGDIGARMDFFDKTATTIFSRLLSDSEKNAITELRNTCSEIFHVTCTGYVSPSAAQRWVAERGGGSTRVRHLYHMGCYAALPAIHQADAACHLGGSIEIVHTELCTLHLNLHSPSLEEMVVQTLFADGACAYRVTAEKPQSPSLRYMNSWEEIIPESMSSMSWGLAHDRFMMVLSKDVPGIVKKALPGILERSLLDPGIIKNPKLIWAIHPGGPKIIDEIQKTFELSEEQVCYSRKVLRERGNMSSATLPHIWNEILKDDAVASGTPVITMAFGPGLTVSLAELQVER